jgi:hypothetical protein
MSPVSPLSLALRCSFVRHSNLTNRLPQRVKSSVLTAHPSLPVYPDQRTFWLSFGMSQTCQ